MAETELTRKIKIELGYYKPSALSGYDLNLFRRKHIAFEVLAETGNIKGGIVDCLRADEYFSDIKHQRRCLYHGKNPEVYDRCIQDCCRHNYVTTAEVPQFCEEQRCRCNGVGKSGTENILITAFEIKITKADFKSKNGHNFVGNLNYYVVPKELKKDVYDLIPADIGLIIYDKGLRQVKHATYKEKTDTEKMWLLLNIMKAKHESNFYREKIAEASE